MSELLSKSHKASKAFECSVEKGINCGTLVEVETSRKIEFYSLSNQVWMCYDKPFSSLALAEMRDAILSRNFTKVSIFEAQAAQVSQVRPGLYGLAIGVESKLEKLPLGCAAQGK